MESMALPYDSLFDAKRASELREEARQIREVLQDKLKRTEEGLTHVTSLITDAVPVADDVIKLERATATYTRLRNERQLKLWEIEFLERQQLIWKERYLELKIKAKALKARKTEAEEAPWAEMVGDLGNGQIERFDGSEEGRKAFIDSINKEYERAKNEYKEAKDNRERCSILISNSKDDISEHERDIGVEGGKLMHKVMQKKVIRCAAFNIANIQRNDVRGFAIGGVDKVALGIEKTIHLIDLFTGQTSLIFMGDEWGTHIGEMLGHWKYVVSLAFYEKWIVSGSVDQTARVWDIDARECLGILKGHTGTVWSVTMDAKKILTGSADKDVRIWLRDTLECVQTVHCHSRTVKTLCVERRMFMTGSSDNCLALWKITGNSRRPYRRCERVCKLRAEEVESFVTVIRFKATEAVSGHSNGKLVIWDLKAGEMLRICEGHDKTVLDLQFSATKIYSCGMDHIIAIHDFATGQRLQQLRGHDGPVLCLQKDTRSMVTIGKDYTLRHWHWTTSSVKRDPVMKKYHVYQKSLGNDLKWISRKYMVSMLDLCEWNKLPVETPDQALWDGQHILVRQREDRPGTPKLFRKHAKRTTYNTGLVRKLRQSLQKKNQDHAVKNDNVALGSDSVAEETIADKRHRKVQLQMMERAVNRDMRKKMDTAGDKMDLDNEKFMDTTIEDVSDTSEDEDEPSVPRGGVINP